jgi:hypothetical protein
MRPEHWLYTIPLRLRSLFRRAQADEQLDDELRDHLERKTEEYVAKGMSPQEALRRVRLDLGGIEQTKEKCRDARRVNWIQDFVQDLHFSLRVLRKSPAFTIVAVLTLGIGANTAIFTMMNGLMLHTLPVRDPGQFVEILHHYPDDPEPGFNGFSWDAYQIMRDGNHVLSDLIIGSLNVYVVSGHALESQTVVGGTFFETLGVRPAIGRLIGPQDTMDSSAVAVVSWSFWKSRFNLNPAIVGQNVVANGTPVTIIGVTQRGFYGLSNQAEQDIWLPFSLGDRSSPGFSVGLLGCMKPRVSIQQAHAGWRRCSVRPSTGPTPILSCVEWNSASRRRETAFPRL